MSAPIQYAAISAYSNDHSEHINNSSNILKSVGEYVYENLKSNVINVTKPEGGFYLFPEFTNTKFSTSSESAIMSNIWCFVYTAIVSFTLRWY